MVKLILIIVPIFFNLTSAFAELSSEVTSEKPKQDLTNTFLYMVTLLKVSHNPTNYTHKCRGVLVSYQHVITSAYCVSSETDNEKHKQVIKAEDHRIVAGKNVMIREIVIITIHPNFFINDADNIAVIQLKTAFPRSAVTPLNLPMTPFLPELYTESRVCQWRTDLHQTLQMAVDQPSIRFNLSSIPPRVFKIKGHDKKTETNGLQSDHIRLFCIIFEDNHFVYPHICNGILTGLLTSKSNFTSTDRGTYIRVPDYSSWIQTLISFKSLPSFYFMVLTTVSQIAFAVIIS